MGLSGSQRQQLQEALMDGFPGKSSLERMLSFELNKKLDVITSATNLSQIVFELIKKAEAENWVEDLVDAARGANSGNQRLKAVAESFRIKTSDEEILEIQDAIVAPEESEYRNQQEVEKGKAVLTVGVRKNWAIVIGINNYDNLQGLKYAQRDAEAMAGWFKDEAGFDKVFVFTNNSPLIYETNPPIPTTPTFGHVRRFLRAQFENTERSLLRSGDNLWFFFAGHGKRYKDKDYLMLADSDPGDLEYTAISVDYVTQRLRRSGADNVVLILDACRDESSRSRGELGIGDEKHQGVITFYSCNTNQQSWEIEELGHGIFTHVLLQGLRSQGEGNCATVERLDQYLRYYVPQMNARYGKPKQNPYLKAEPPYKTYFILLEQSATLRDVQPLKFQASLAENEGNLILAEQLWVRVLAVSRADLDAIGAIQRIAIKKTSAKQQPISEVAIPISEGGTSLRGEGVEISQSETQKEEQHEENLGRYRQSFSEIVEEEFPLSEVSRSKLREMQQSLQITDKEVLEIEQPIITEKEAEYHQRQEEERIRQQQEAEKHQVFKFEVVTEKVVKSPKFFGLWSKSEVILKKEYREAEHFREDLGNGISLDMVYIPGGKFMMGSPEGEGYDKEKPQHEVTVSSFYMGKFQVTQAQWKAVASFPQVERELKPEPSIFKGDNCPVEKVSWNDAVEFCARLSKHTGREYRLPSEAEWEYACRAGTTTPFHFGKTITGDLANYSAINVYANESKGQYRGETTPVGQFPANAFGLYDMHGNVWEWCFDDWHSNYEKAPTDGSAWIENENDNRSQYKVRRGGSWNGNPRHCRSAYRSNLNPEVRYRIIGFRVVCAVAQRSLQ